MPWKYQIFICIKEEYCTKDIKNILNKTSEENFPELKKSIPRQLQEACGTPWNIMGIILKMWTKTVLKAANDQGSVTVYASPT